MIQRWRGAVVVVAVILTGLPAYSAGQGRDELWEITTKMEMPGMPMAMPPHTQQICKPAGKAASEEMVPMEGDCKMTDVKQSGNRTTFTMLCTGKNTITATGEMESDPASYRGSMRMKGSMDGRPMDMTETFSGKRIGQCTYEDPKKKHDAMVASQCAQALDQMEVGMFALEQSPCQDRKAEFCSRVSGLAQDMREPAGYRATVQKRADWSQMLSTCNQDPAAITKQACARSVQTKDFTFTMQYCEADAKALSQQYCEGRDYTAAMASEYAPICRRYAFRPGRSADPAAPNITTVPPQSQPPQPPSPADKVKEGVGTLKRFLGF